MNRLFGVARKKKGPILRNGMVVTDRVTKKILGLLSGVPRVARKRPAASRRSAGGAKCQ